MPSESDEAVEVTLTPTIEDYRSVTYQVGGVFAWNAALIGLLTLGAFLSWAAAQAIGAAILGGTAILLLVYTYISMNMQLRRLPSWVFAAHTYRISGEGLTISSPAGYRLIRWGAFSATRKDPVAYWFIGPGNTRVPLFRRTLSACSLTWLVLLSFEGLLAFDGFADVVAGGGVPVSESRWPSGSGPGWFWCTGW